MPAPLLLAPAALPALGWAVAAAAVALTLARRRPAPLRPETEEAALDASPEGLRLDGGHEGPGRARADGALRLRRVLRLGPGGPGVAVDLAALGRLRLSRLP